MSASDLRRKVRRLGEALSARGLAPSAFEDGVLAASRAEGARANPYAEASAEHVAWRSGWQAVYRWHRIAQIARDGQARAQREANELTARLAAATLQVTTAREALAHIRATCVGSISRGLAQRALDGIEALDTAASAGPTR